MRTSIFTAILGVASIMGTACAHSAPSVAPQAYVPRGQAAQPAAWSSGAHAGVLPSGEPRGQAAQPHAWPVPSRAVEPTIGYAYAAGAPAGQAAQPSAWIARAH